MTILDAGIANSMDGAPTFSLGNRLYRVLWGLCWLILARWTPPFFNPWRVLLLRLFGARLHKTAKIYSSARIWSPANLEMAERSCVGPGAIIYTMARISLGPRSIVSQGAHLCTGTHDIDDPNFQLRARPIHIGSRAWVAAEAFVGPGVTVGDGAVLGARACAMRDVEALGVYSGNPAQKIRQRRLRLDAVGNAERIA